MSMTAARSVMTAVVALGLACGRNYPVAKPGERLRELPGTAVVAALPTQGLRVLVWNVKKSQMPSWSIDFERLAGAADLVLLQEAHDHERFRGGIGTRVDMHWQMGISFFFAKQNSAATGVATGATARADTATVVHAPKREPVVPTPKATLLTTYPLEGRADALLVVNIHAINFRRAKHLREHLETASAAITRHNGSVIFAGDFNTHHRPRMAVVEQFASDHGLHPVFPNWVEGAGKKPVVDGRMRHLKLPLDHVYVRGLRATCARVRPEVAGSDHKPLEVVFDVEPQRAP